MHPSEDIDLLRNEDAQRRMLERILQPASSPPCLCPLRDAAGPRLGEQTIRDFALREMRREQSLPNDPDLLAVFEVSGVRLDKSGSR